MKLSTKQEKIKFLQECYDNINRILLTYLTESERRYSSEKVIIESDDKIYKNLPILIEFDSYMGNLKLGKLIVLVDIYNQVAEATKKEEVVNLQNVFNKVKYEKNSVAISRLHGSITKVLSAHRKHDLRQLPDIMSYLFPPKSKAFLDKYGFFEDKEELRLVEAIRHRETWRVRALLLVTSKSEINKRDNYGYGESALTAAASNGNIEIADLLINSGAKIDGDCLNAAIIAGDLDMLCHLLNKGGDVNKPDSKGITPLRQAITSVFSFNFSGKEPHPNPRLRIMDKILEKDIQWLNHSKDKESIFDYIRKCAVKDASYCAKELAEISKSLVEVEEKFISEQKKRAEVRKNARVLAQGMEDRNSPFWRVPKDIGIRIAALTGSEDLNEKESVALATKYFSRP